MKYKNNHKLPSSIVDAIKNNTYDLSNFNPRVISATTLKNSPKTRLLTGRHWDKISVDVSDNLWVLLGSSVHAILERISDKGRFIEERINKVFWYCKDCKSFDILEEDSGGTLPDLYEKVGTEKILVLSGEKQMICKKCGKKANYIIISGKTDLYDYNKKTIEDYKVTSAWTIVFDSQRTEWEKQLNIYGYLFRDSGFEVKGLAVNAILRDWSRSKAKKDKKYPRIPFKRIPLKLWSLEKQEQYIKERILLHIENENKKDDDIPICSKEDRWVKGEKYAVYKNNNKTASKVCNSKGEAEFFIKKQDQKHTWRIEFREGEDVKCKSYCKVNKFCNYWKEKYEEDF